MTILQVSLHFDPVREILKYDVRFIFKEESDYSEENTNDNEHFRFSLSLNRKKRVVMRANAKETKHIYTSAANLLHIRIGNLNWCKCGHCKNEVREIDCLCWRGVDAMFTVSAKIPEAREASRHSTFMGNFPTFSHTC